MNIEYLKKLIISQEEDYLEFFSKNHVINRDIDTNKLKSFLKHPNILIITGIRRSGKSILSQLLYNGEKFAYFNFFDERLTNFNSQDLETLVQAFYELYGNARDHFIFDEIQEIDGWEKFASRLRINNKLIITGSNSKLLSRELSTYLTGRHIDFTLFPFDFKEYLIFHGINLKDHWEYSDKIVSEVRSNLNKYLQNGGFPENLTIGKNIILQIYRDILEKDITGRYNIRKNGALKEIANYLIANAGNEITFNKIRSIFNIKNVHTVINYANYISSSFLVYFVNRFSFKLKEQFIAPRKVYCIDNGIITSINLNMDGQQGKLMENLVYISLIKNKSYNFDNYDVFYWKDAMQREVDFIIKKENKILKLIQVTYASSREEITDREIKNLIIASTELHCNDLMVITWNYEAEEEIQGNKIKFVPLWKWLLLYD